MSTKVHVVAEKSVGEVEVDNKVNLKAWAKGFVIAAFFVAIPALLSGFRAADETNTDETQYLLSVFSWCASFVPLAVYLVLQVAFFSKLARRLAFDMIEERSVGTSIRDTARNNLTNQGLMAALFLTVVYAMLQTDPLFEDSYRMLPQWYASLLSMSVGWLSVAILSSSLCLLYTEPLDDEAVLSLMSDNIMYFG